MKKIMIALAVALTAGMMQAASLTWTALNIRDSAGEAADAGWVAVLMDSSVVFDYAKFAAGEQTALYTSATASYGTAGLVRVSESGLGSYDKGDSVSAYTVIFNASTVAGATEYIVSSVKSASVGDTGNNMTLAFGNMGATTSAFYGQSWTAVPEPTSGLLMLVGIAGLALRRRRA